MHQEITEAKEALWRISGEALLGKMIKRQGSSKLVSELNDVSSALKTLSEKDALPMFLGTSLMVSQTPIYQLDSEDKSGDKKLDNIEKSLNSIWNEINGKNDSVISGEDKDDNTNINDGNKRVKTALCDTIAVDDISSSGPPWSEIVRHGRKKFSQQWKENDKPIPTNQTNLVISGIELGTRGLQIAQYLENLDVGVFDWSLLTTRDDATFLTFKITVKKADADKLKDRSLWLEGWQIRPYNPPKTKKRERGDKSDNAGQMRSAAQTRSNVSMMNNLYPDSNNGNEQSFRLPGNVPVEISQPATYNWQYNRTGAMHPGNVVRNAPWNGVKNQNALGTNWIGNLSSGGNIPLGVSNPGVAMQDTFYGGNVPYTLSNIPTSSRPKKQVQFLDRIGMDLFTQEY